MIRPHRIVGWLLGVVLALPAAALASPLVFESPSGPLTLREIAGFKSWAQAFHPDADNQGDAWAFGHSGQALEALGLMYEATGDRDFLDRMIEIAGVGLAERNDLAPAPVGHRPLWPGISTPAWGNEAPGSAGAGHAGPETGDAAGKIAYAAYLILKTPGLDGVAVPDGDPGQFGKTYGERARTFVRLLDATEDQFILAWFVRKDDGDRFYYPKDRRYIQALGNERNNAGNAVPWNQQFMIDCGLQRLAQCHELLRDDPARIALYDACVRASLSWMLQSVTSHRDLGGHGVYYTWSYAADDAKHVEDSVHAGLDLEGLYRCYLSGRYAIVLNRSHLQAFANEVADVMSLGGGRFAGIVDGNAKGGHAVSTDFPRPDVLVVLEFRPDVFPAIAQAAMAAKRTAGDPTAVSHLLWVKYRLTQNLATAP